MVQLRLRERERRREGGLLIQFDASVNLHGIALERSGKERAIENDEGRKESDRGKSRKRFCKERRHKIGNPSWNDLIWVL